MIYMTLNGLHCADVLLSNYSLTFVMISRDEIMPSVSTVYAIDPIWSSL